jgi:hypothetical protein
MTLNFKYCPVLWVPRWHSWLMHCATSRKVAGSLPNITTEILQRLNPGVDSDACKNEYHQHFLGGESDRYIGLTNLPLSCANCLEFCEPSGPVQASTRIAERFRYENLFMPNLVKICSGELLCPRG